MPPRIICPKCKSIGFQPDIMLNHYVGRQKCVICSGTGYLTKFEELNGLECPFPIVLEPTGEILAQSEEDKPIHITSELARLILDGSAYIDVEFDDSLNIVHLPSGRLYEAYTFEQLLRIWHKAQGIPLSSLREAYEEYCEKNKFFNRDCWWVEAEYHARAIMRYIKK